MVAYYLLFPPNYEVAFFPNFCASQSRALFCNLKLTIDRTVVVANGWLASKSTYCPIAVQVENQGYCKTSPDQGVQVGSKSEAERVSQI